MNDGYSQNWRTTEVRLEGEERNEALRQEELGGAPQRRKSAAQELVAVVAQAQGVEQEALEALTKRKR
jgi:hypothetical protein